MLDNVIAAAFDTATRLFGLKFKELPDAPRYHEDVRVWEVTDKRGEPRRPVPRRLLRAALEALRRLDVGVPLAVEGGGRGEPDHRQRHELRAGRARASRALLSLDDARTLFHEFGHGLHGLLSDVTYPSISGTAVTRDFVELPSQLYEHWLMVPEVLERFAVHHETGKPMPAKLLSRIKKARNFNQGFSTIEYLASAFVDMELHAHRGRRVSSTSTRSSAARSIASACRARSSCATASRTSCTSWAATRPGYYSYLWSEVMDADAFAAFEEAGNTFDAETAKKLHKYIYSGGNQRDPLEAYVAFRGRPPEIAGLLKKRGLAVSKMSSSDLRGSASSACVTRERTRALRVGRPCCASMRLPQPGPGGADDGAGLALLQQNDGGLGLRAASPRCGRAAGSSPCRSTSRRAASRARCWCR